MAILLVGSTGNGKSAFGNFLVNPDKDHIFGQKQTFRTARANLPQTQIISVGTFRHEGKTQFTVVDTPGLNESASKDLSHMIDIVKKLRSLETIKACVLCTKFDAKIDAQYMATIRYYSKLLPTIFEGNVVVVMTNYATDERSVMVRQQQGIDEEQMKENTITKLKKIAGISYCPQLFTIDCLPFMPEECEISLKTRNAILDYIATLRVIPTKTLLVAKTDCLKERHEKQVEKLHGEISGYNQRLKQANVKAKQALDKIEKEELKKSQLDAELSQLQDEIDLKDTDELAAAEHWSVRCESKKFSSLSRDVDLTSPWELANVKKWTNGECEWKNEEQTLYRYKGQLKGKFRRGLYASVTLETPKKKKYATELATLRSRIQDKEKLIGSVRNLLAEMNSKHKDFNDEIKVLKQHCEEKLQQVKALSTNYLYLWKQPRLH